MVTEPKIEARNTPGVGLGRQDIGFGFAVNKARDFDRAHGGANRDVPDDSPGCRRTPQRGGKFF